MESYVAPSRGEGMRVQQLVQELRQVASSGEPLDEVREDAALLALEIRELEGHLLLEDPTARGWGKVLFRRGEPTGLVVEVPHPLSDYRTPELGLRMFEQSGADVYLLNGANRYNSERPSLEQPSRRVTDAAHSGATFFHQAHCGLVGSGDTVLQVHGFDSEPGDPVAVLSDGQDDGRDPAPLTGLAEELGEQGLSYLVSDFASPLARRLGGRTNLQGQQRQGLFLHMEVGEEARRDLEPRLIQAVANWASEVFSARAYKLR